MNTELVNKNKKTLSLTCLLDFLACLSVALLVFCPPYFVINSTTNKIIFCAYLSFYSAINVPFLLNRKNRTIPLVSILLYSVFAIVSGYLGLQFSFSRNTLIASIVHAITIVSSAFSISVFFCKGNIALLLKTIFAVLCVSLVVNDLFILITNDGFLLKDTYFVGGKFAVSYRHLFFICLLWRLYGNKMRHFKWLFLILCVFEMFISKTVLCSTGIVGGFILLLVGLLGKRFQSLAFNPITSAILCLFAFMFVFLCPSILRIGLVQKVVVDVLGEDITLSSRVSIFECLPDLFANRVMFGYGYGSVNDLLLATTGCYDTQNGLWELIIASGLPCAFFFVVCLLSPFFVKEKDGTSLLPYLLLMIIISSVEITYGANTLIIAFLTWCDLKNGGKYANS